MIVIVCIWTAPFSRLMLTHIPYLPVLVSILIWVELKDIDFYWYYVNVSMCLKLYIDIMSYPNFGSNSINSYWYPNCLSFSSMIFSAIDLWDFPWSPIEFHWIPHHPSMFPFNFQIILIFPAFSHHFSSSFPAFSHWSSEEDLGWAGRGRWGHRCAEYGRLDEGHGPAAGLTIKWWLILDGNIYGWLYGLIWLIMWLIMWLIGWLVDLC